MAFEMKDFFRSYNKKGGDVGFFNPVREDSTSAVVQYYAYQNDEGSFIVQRSATVVTTAILAYEYYGSNKLNDFDTDWGNRASLTYGEYHELFNKNLD